MNCLADDTVHDFIHGQLSEVERSRVDEHLDCCVDCRSLVVAMVHTSHDSGPLPGDPFSLRQGAVVGRYMMLEMVGEGAMGVVFAAYDPELNRKVAIKFVRGTAGASSERLLREAQAMARLSHANVVTIYETGKMDDSVFIAMELVSGTTLREWLRAQERSAKEIVSLLLQAARGLQAAHNAGLVHRDFKPDNVLIADDGRARVTDFGLARGEQSEASEPPRGILALGSNELAQTMTRTGTLLGTPAYMAPEQMRGEEATCSADQYALCISLYEALCGNRPFEGSTLAQLRRSAEHDKPNFQSPLKLSKALQGVIARGLQPKVSDRYASMDQLIEALEATTGKRTRMWAAGTGALLVGAAAATLLMSGTRDERSACASASDDFQRVWTSDRQDAVEQALARLDAPYAGTAALSITRSLERWRSDWVEESTNTCKATRVSSTQSEELMDVRMQCLQRELSTFDALTRELAGAASPVLLRDFEQALPDVAACRDTVSLQAIPRPAPEQVPLVAAIEDGVAQARAQLAIGAYAAARQVAVDTYQRAAALGYMPGVSTSALELARAEQKAGNLSAASRAIETAAMAALRSRSERGVIGAWIQAVAIYGEAGLYDKALQSAGYAEAAFDRISESGRLRAMLANNWGTVLYRMNRYPEAREQLERSYQLRVSLLGEESTLVARSLTNLGNLERVSGNLPEALAHHRKALALDKRLLGDLHPEIGRHLHNVAGVLRLQGKRREAVTTYEKALDLRRQALGPVHQDVALTLNSLGLVHAELGESDRARAYYLESLASYPEPDHPQRALSLHGLGLLDVDVGSHQRAQAYFREALADFTRSFDDSHERVMRVLLALSSSLLDTGHVEEARRLVARAQAAANAAFDAELALLLERSAGLDAEVPPAPAVKTATPGGKMLTTRALSANAASSNDKAPPAKAGNALPPPAKGNALPSPAKAGNALPVKNKGMYGSSPAWD